MSKGHSLGGTHGGFSCCTASWHAGFNSAAHGIDSVSVRLQGAWAPVIRRTGFVALLHVGSSQTRERTRVPCTGRWIPIHCNTREVHYLLVSKSLDLWVFIWGELTPSGASTMARDTLIFIIKTGILVLVIRDQGCY